MGTAVLVTLTLAALLLVAGGIAAFIGIRNAPLAEEESDGLRILEDKREHAGAAAAPSTVKL